MSHNTLKNLIEDYVRNKLAELLDFNTSDYLADLEFDYEYGFGSREKIVNFINVISSECDKEIEELCSLIENKLEEITNETFKKVKKRR